MLYDYFWRRLTVHRTQVYLDDRHYEILRTRAKRERKSLAALIREILDAHLVKIQGKSKNDPLAEAIGIGAGDGSAVAENYEDYLYGER